MPHLPVRIAATDALNETVSKGMPSSDKLELVRILGLQEVLTKLYQDTSEQRKAAAATGPDEQQLAFGLGVARLLNTVGSELIKVCEDVSGNGEQREAH